MNYFGEVTSTKKLKEKLINKPISFVMFYANWCGYCKIIQKHWNKFGKINKINNLQMICIESKNIDTSLDIKGFPTLTIYNNGEIIDYKDGREFKDFCKYFKMCENCGKKKV